MIDREKYLLTCLAEEAAEVAQRATKSVRFGLDEVQPGQTKDNLDRLMEELGDLDALRKMLGLRFPTSEEFAAIYRAKQEKVDRFYQYSVDLGEAEPVKGGAA